MISGPPVVLKPGRTALRISTSALDEYSSLYQNAASSAMTAMLKWGHAGDGNCLSGLQC